jgi:hypothetical protein
MVDAVLDWDRIIHKNVRSKDMEDVGNVFSIAGDIITIMGGKVREYNIPKSHIEGFNGSEVFLDIPYDELRNYEIKSS